MRGARPITFAKALAVVICLISIGPQSHAQPLEALATSGSSPNTSHPSHFTKRADRAPDRDTARDEAYLKAVTEGVGRYGNQINYNHPEVNQFPWKLPVNLDRMGYTTEDLYNKRIDDFQWMPEDIRDDCFPRNFRNAPGQTPKVISIEHTHAREGDAEDDEGHVESHQASGYRLDNLYIRETRTIVAFYDGRNEEQDKGETMKEGPLDTWQEMVYVDLLALAAEYNHGRVWPIKQIIFRKVPVDDYHTIADAVQRYKWPRGTKFPPAQINHVPVPPQVMILT